MTPDEALAVACDRCLSPAALLAVARLAPDVDDHRAGKAMAAAGTAGWADHRTVGSATPEGINVRDRATRVTVRVEWGQVAAMVRAGLAEPGTSERLTRTFARYQAATGDPSAAGRLAAKAAAVELAQVRHLVLDRARGVVPVQQSLFGRPPTHARSLP